MSQPRPTSEAISARDWLAEVAACTKSTQLVPIYVELIEASGPKPIGEVNAVILSRWARSTLATIKTKAWRIVDKRIAERHRAALSQVKP